MCSSQDIVVRLCTGGETEFHLKLSIPGPSLPPGSDECLWVSFSPIQAVEEQDNQDLLQLTSDPPAANLRDFRMEAPSFLEGQSGPDAQVSSASGWLTVTQWWNIKGVSCWSTVKPSVAGVRQSRGNLQQKPRERDIMLGTCAKSGGRDLVQVCVISSLGERFS